MKPPSLPLSMRTRSDISPNTPFGAALLEAIRAVIESDEYLTAMAGDLRRELPPGVRRQANLCRHAENTVDQLAWVIANV